MKVGDSALDLEISEVGTITAIWDDNGTQMAELENDDHAWDAPLDEIEPSNQ